jgi:C-terminal processing protease CtpA/Prc
VQETESFSFTFQSVATTGYELPVEYGLLGQENIAIASIGDFLDNRALTIQLWERMIQELNDNQPRGLIIDMRNNGGGIGFLADQMAAYFFDEPLVVGKRFVYSDDLGEFYSDPRLDDRFYLPAEDLRYRGNVVVLVGPDCASACERFAYAMSLEGRAEIIGHYPTAGLGGGVDEFLMPGGLTIRFTGSRSTNADGEIHIEGLGVVPTLRIPVTKESLLSSNDVVLEAAIEYLLNN